MAFLSMAYDDETEKVEFRKQRSHELADFQKLAKPFILRLLKIKTRTLPCKIINRTTRTHRLKDFI